MFNNLISVAFDSPISVQLSQVCVDREIRRDVMVLGKGEVAMVTQMRIRSSVERVQHNDLIR